MSASPLVNGHVNLENEEVSHDETGAELNIFKPSSIADIQATLEALNVREASVTERLDSLVASQKDLSRELGRLDLLRVQLGSQVVNTRSISNGMFSDAASTASRISSAVKRLDLEQSRVQATLEVVEQVAELKACVLGVTGSMGAPHDWETAAGYLNRASKIPKEIVTGSFAEEIVPTAEVPDLPSVTLETAAESLCALFLREFEKAAKEADGAKVTRFFKLFPLIGRSDVGLDVYGRYVCQGVASRARSNLNAGTGGNQRSEGFFYASALTKLFEHIAQIVDGHGGLVERHYGVGKMVKVIERLQAEADMQGGIILDTWADERYIDRKLTDIKSYAFSFLVQSFLPSQRGSGGALRSDSPSSRDPAAGRNSEDEGVDMKEVDGLLSEAAVMLGRWSLYSRFLALKCRDPHLDEEGQHEPSPLTVPPLLSESALSKKTAARLIEPFNTMTMFFFRRSVEKAFQLDEPPTGLSLNLNKPLQASAPFITSAVDDVMYIVNNVLQRSLATSSRAVVANVIPTIGRVLGSDFVGMIQRKMRDESYPKAAVQGGLPPENKIIDFVVLINNLDLATDYTKRIVQTLLKSDSANETGNQEAASSLVDMFPFNHDAVFVTNSLKTLGNSFEAKTSELVGDGINVLFSHVIKPRLRPILADAFREANYMLNSEELTSIAARQEIDEVGEGMPEEMVKDRFAHGWEALIKPFQRLLTAHNFDKLLTAAVFYLSRVLEKRIWGYYGRVNELGAVRLERDIAGLIGIAVKGGRYGLREAFTRCTQICLIMNMEEDEWYELQSAGEQETGAAMHWHLGVDEKERARAMVQDSKGQ
ncbi:MAG: hypothetical protein M1819_002477 [Sarea resinae]|nr:MAG: hypothetical protein M1819_002477 [Sarea resinae]